MSLPSWSITGTVVFLEANFPLIKMAWNLEVYSLYPLSDTYLICLASSSWPIFVFCATGSFVDKKYVFAFPANVADACTSPLSVVLQLKVMVLGSHSTSVWFGLLALFRKSGGSEDTLLPSSFGTFLPCRFLGGLFWPLHCCFCCHQSCLWFASLVGHSSLLEDY